MLLIHRSEQAGPLVTALGELLAAPSGLSADPFAPELVAVPSAGVERWLAQRLSHVLGARADGDGVCANVVFGSSNRVLDDAVTRARPDYAVAAERWADERVVWSLLTTIDDSVRAGAPWADVLAVHLGGRAGDTDTRRGRRYAVAAKLARLFAAYGRARPGMLRAWQDGRDEQGDGTALPADLRWQAQLWREVRAELGPAPAELLDPACARLRADPALAELPARFSVFGTTRISPARVAVLDALAAHRDVHLWLHHPSPALWQAQAAADEQPGRRAGARTDLVRNPLLASLSRDLRELQQLLPAARDVHHPTGSRPDTLLGRLQRDLAADTVRAAPQPMAVDDRSLTVHACHGPARQVEVLREAVLARLAADPTLEPRDVLIMCPDVETFAPLVAASFGTVDETGGHPAGRLRVRLADRSLRQTNPLLGLLAQLLELAGSRVTATQLLDLAGTAPVRARFGFGDDDLEQLRDWTSAANARWGLDAAHRAPYGLDALAQGTWRAALDRLLVGVAMEEDDRWLGPVLPLDDVDSGGIDLAGRLAELLDRVDAAVRALDRRHTVTQWAALLTELVLDLGEPEQAWQAAQLRGELADVAESADPSTDVELGRADIAALLHGRLAGRPTRASFRTGTLTVCTLVPMRSVPHRVVCLLGLDDGVFPRQTVLDGDDVLARDPRTGERDVRSEDRQLFLDAICAAQEHLIVAYTGADPRSGAEVPPCVPLGELLDAVDATALAPDGGPARGHVVVRHPLQPFDARNFAADGLGGGGPFSFDPDALAAACAAEGERRPVPTLLPAPLGPAPAGDTVELDELVRFVQHPARAFLRQRLGISTYDEDDEPDDALPVDLDGLQQWALGDRMLRRCLAGMPPATCVELERRRGGIPPGPLGQALTREVGGRITALLAACELERATDPVSLDVAVPLPDGRVLSGTVTGVRGDTVLTVGYASLSARHRVAAWVRHLALAAAGHRLHSVTVGRSRGGARRAIVEPVAAGAARAMLGELVALRDAGLREPLPLPLAAGYEYAERRHRGAPVADAVDAAERKWATDRYAPENAEPEHVLAFGAGRPLAALLAEPDSGHPDETTRFGALARALWTPLLAVEIDVRP